jgi:methyl-accepting chemotaxis protein
MRSRSLRTKINRAIITTCLIVCGSFAAILYPFELHRREARLEKIQILLSSIFQQRKDELANEIFAGQRLALKNSLQEMLHVKDLAFLSVFSPEGRLVISTKDSTQAFHPESLGESFNQNSQGFSKRVIKGRSFAEFSAPIDAIGERIGYIKMYYDLSNVEKESTMAIGIFFSLLLLTLLVMAVFLNLFLSRFVIHPVSNLREAIGKVRKGYLGEQVSITSHDEIGEMANPLMKCLKG